MEGSSHNPPSWVDMSEASRVGRSRGTAILLAIIAVAMVVVYALLPVGHPRTRRSPSEAMVAASCVIGAMVIARAVIHGAWRGAIWLAWTLLVLRRRERLVLRARCRPAAPATGRGPIDAVLPRPADPAAEAGGRRGATAFRTAAAQGAERRPLAHHGLAHRDPVPGDPAAVRRRAGLDLLRRSSRSSRRRSSRSSARSRSGFPTRAHLLQALAVRDDGRHHGDVRLAMGARHLRGHDHVDRPQPGADRRSAFAAITVLEPTHRDRHRPQDPHRWTRPVLTSLAVATACAASRSWSRCFDRHTGDRLRRSPPS